MMRKHVALFLVGLIVLIVLSEKAAAQWMETNMPKSGWITALAVKGTDLIAATREGGVFITEDQGTTWRAINSGLPDKADFQCLAVMGPNILVGSVGHGVYLSTDNGSSWKASNSGLPEDCSVFRLEVSGTNLFAVAGVKRASVFVSSDYGANWKAADSGLPETEVFCLAASGANLYAGTGTPITGQDACVFLSTDNAESWEEVNLGLPLGNPILRFAVHEGNLFAGSWHAGRVFRSRIGGKSWEMSCSGLPDPMDFSLSDLVSCGPYLFLGSFKGVFFSTDLGANWESITSGLSEPSAIYCLAAGESNLFAGTEDGKVWRLPLSDVSLAANLSDQILTEDQWTHIRKEHPDAVVIPDDIKSVMQEGLETRQGRQDIPFTIFKSLIFPAKDIPKNILLFSPSRIIMLEMPPKDPDMDSIHVVIFFRSRNSDLGYAASTPPSDPEQQQQDSSSSVGVHEAELNLFIEFRQTNELGDSKVVREVYTPALFKQDSETYKPDRLEWYSVGYTLRPGKYTAVMAITPLEDLKKIGVNYFDIEVPGPESYRTTLTTTPVFFIRRLMMIEPDIVPDLHRGMFTWSKYQILPQIDNVLTQGERLWSAFCLLGAKPKGAFDGRSRYDVDAVYEVRDEAGAVVTRYEARNRHLAQIFQQMPLKQTVKIKDDKGEWSEQRDLEAGNYILVIKVKDNVSGAAIEKKVPFEIR